MPNSYQSWRTGVQIDNIYPVGVIYLSVDATNPGSLFGGTWEQIQNTFLLAAGSSYTAGATGGSTTMAHTHQQVAVTTGGSSAANTGGSSAANTGSTAITIAQMPSHSHRTSWNGTSSNNNVGWGFNYTSKQSQWSQSTAIASTGLEFTGGGGGHTHTMSHTHTISHTHDIAATNTGGASNTSIMPPYLVVYMWKRIQ